VVAEPLIFALVSAVAELSPEVAVLAAEPEDLALVSLAAELSPEVAVLAAEPEAVLAAVVLVAVVSEPQASVDIAVAFVVLVLVSGVVGEVDSPGRPKFVVSPNTYSSPSLSSSVEFDGEVFVGSSIGARTNYGLCSTLSNLDPHQNKNREHTYNKPSPGHNNVSDTNGLPMGATTNHSRKKGLPQHQEKRKHMSQAALSILVVRQIRWAAENQY
jgi:hypothetical protein